MSSTTTAASAPFVTLHALQAFPTRMSSSANAPRRPMRSHHPDGSGYGLRTTPSRGTTATALAERPGRPAHDAAAMTVSDFGQLAFSVDAVSIESDFWTVVGEDRAVSAIPSGNTGESDMSAPILYRTAYLDRRRLRKTLAAAGAGMEDFARSGERNFIEWFIQAVPPALRTSVSATLPSLVIASLGPQPVSVGDAFAVPEQNQDTMDGAASRLLSALDRVGAVGGGHHVYFSTAPAIDAALAGRITYLDLAAFLETVTAL